MRDEDVKVDPTSSEAELEAQLLQVLEEEAAACASLLDWAQEAQQALLAMDPDRIARASHQQLKTLASLHRIELARRAILMAWAERHKMAFPSVTVTDVAGRIDPSRAEQLMQLAQQVSERLSELALINQCNKGLIRSELELHRALWRQVTQDEIGGGLYGPTGQPHSDRSSGRLIEHQA